jgi:hypothetical protein
MYPIYFNDGLFAQVFPNTTTEVVAPATVTISKPSIALRARGVATFTVQFTAPSLPAQAVFGGYLTLNAAGTIYSVRCTIQDRIEGMNCSLDRGSP